MNFVKKKNKLKCILSTCSVLGAGNTKKRTSQVALVIKNASVNAGDIKDVGLIPGLGRSPGEGWQPTPVILPGESHGQRSLAGYSAWTRKESDNGNKKKRMRMLRSWADTLPAGACSQERREETLAVTERTHTKKAGAPGRQRVRTSGAWVGADTRAHSRDLGPQGKKTSVPTSPSFHIPLHSHRRTKPCRGQGFEDTLPYPGPHRLAPCPMPCFLTCGPPSPAVHSRASAWQGQCPRMSNLTQTWCIAALNSAKAVRGRGEMELASDGRQGATPTLLGLTHQEDIG